MSTPTITPAPPLNAGPSEIIAWQRECLRNQSYQVLGRIWMIVLEAAAGAHVPGKSVANTLGSRIEFYNQAGGPEVLGPAIAQTGARGSLLILDPLVRDDGHVGLPDIPDPTWKPPVPKASDLTNPTKTYVPPKAPMIPQKLVCPCQACQSGHVNRCQGPGGRSRGKIFDNTGRPYLVCGPLAQLAVRPLDGQHHILPSALILKCLPSTPIPGTNSTMMEMLVDAQTGEAFLIGGRFEILNVG